MDGVGEWATTSVGVGRGNQHRDQRRRSTSRTRSACSTRRSPTTPASRSIPASTRSWASRPTASRDTPTLILEHLIDLKPDGSFRLDHGLFRLLHRADDDERAGSTDCSAAPPRKPEELLTQRHMDLAASIQAVTEEVVLRMTRSARQRDRLQQPVPRRRRRAELRRERQGSARRQLRATSGSSRRPAMPAGRWARRSRPITIISGASRATPRPATTACKARYLGPLQPAGDRDAA